MSDIKQAKRDMLKLLARVLGKKLKEITQQAEEDRRLTKEEVSEVLLNKNYPRYQRRKMIAIISHTEDTKLMKMCLRNIRNRGLNAAISEFTEITQLGAFLYDLLPEKEGGVFGKSQKEYEDSKLY